MDRNPAAISPQSVSSADVIPAPPPEAYSTAAQTNPSHAYLKAEASLSASGDVSNSETPGGLIARKPEDPAWAPDYYMEKGKEQLLPVLSLIACIIQSHVLQSCLK